MRSTCCILALVVVLTILACSGGRLQPLELTPWSPPRGQSCDTSPPSLALDAVLDTAVLAAHVAGLALPDGGILLTVSGAEEGPADLRRLETTFHVDVAAEVESALAGSRRPTPGQGSARLLLRTSGGAISELAVGPTERCRPSVRNTVELSRLLQELYEQARREAVATIWLFVGTDEQVSDVRIARSSGYPELDLAFVRIGRRAKLHPALSERGIVPVWVSLDLRIEAQCGPPSDTASFPLLDDPCFGLSGR